jgi:hypothetical protein
MRSVSFFLASLLILFLLITCIGLFLPAHVTISRAVDIPSAANWPVVTAGDRTIGLRTPNGNLLLIRSKDDSTVLVKGLEAASVDSDMGFRLIGAPTDRQVTVQWYMNFYFDWYPWERFSSLLLENKFGTIMEQGLRQLEQQVQSAAPTN